MKIQYILSALLCLCLLITPAAAAGGAGTASNPYIIQTPAELQSVQNDLSAYYVLGNDINMDGFSFTPIGSTAAPFFGSLDGQGYTIRNLNIDLPSTTNVGLFAAIASGTIIKNLNFEDCTISGESHTSTLYGRCVGPSSVTTITIIQDIGIDNCSVTGNGNYVGGLAGSINGAQRANIVLSNCVVENCVINGNGNYVGGVAGYGVEGSLGTIYENRIKNCIVNGYALVGGLMGRAVGSSNQVIAYGNIIENCVITSDTGFVGGLAGSLAYSTSQATAYGNIIENCVITSDTGGRVGGLAGSLAHPTSQATVYDNIVENCTINTNSSYAGGIGGWNLGLCSISNCTVSNNTVTASSYAGGICPIFTE